MVKNEGFKWRIERQAKPLKTKSACAKLAPRTTELQGG